jgi:hypothetical protein
MKRSWKKCWAISSVVEQGFYTAKVGSSTLSSPTMYKTKRGTSQGFPVSFRFRQMCNRVFIYEYLHFTSEARGFCEI